MRQTIKEILVTTNNLYLIFRITRRYFLKNRLPASRIYTIYIGRIECTIQKQVRQPRRNCAQKVRRKPQFAVSRDDRQPLKRYRNKKSRYIAISQRQITVGSRPGLNCVPAVKKKKSFFPQK